MSAGRFGGVVALLALAAACDTTELTQVVVVVDSDTEEFARVRLSFEGLSRVQPVDIDVTAQGLPRRVTLVHDGGPLGPFGVTASAFDAGATEPALIERRRELFFERDRARMLKIDLLHDCIGHCNEDQACFAGQRCESNSGADARHLDEWTGDVTPLGVREHDGGGGDGGGDGGGGDTDAGSPGMVDAGDSGTIRDPVEPASAFPYEPTNFDPAAELVPESRSAVMLNCVAPSFDSSGSFSFEGWCGAEPFATVITQGDGSEAALLVMDTLEIGVDTTLRLTGTRPVIFAVYGDAELLGGIDASAAGTTPGAGGNIDCGAGAGAPGMSVASGPSAPSGGGGGGFGSAGGQGGGSDATPRAAGGSMLEGDTLSPLRGGCPGGDGGLGDGASAARGGAGGGALQISTAGRLDVLGWIAANGSGGGATDELRDGGGGGGSGGAILLEGNAVIFDSAALVVANGGGGGGGNPTALDERSSAGAEPDRSTAAASGGEGANSGGNGGDGAARGTAAGDGEDAEKAQISDDFGAGGGGGGGAGRIVVNQGSACISRGMFSPALDNECSGACTDCMQLGLPSPECEIVESSTRSYVHCADTLTWAEAQASCESAELTLARGDDDAEQSFLTDLVTDYTWLGARDVVEGEWQWEPAGTTFFLEQSGEPVDGAFEDWAPGQPDNNSASGSGDQDCMAESEYGWIDYDCAESLPYICEPPP